MSTTTKIHATFFEPLKLISGCESEKGDEVMKIDSQLNESQQLRKSFYFPTKHINSSHLMFVSLDNFDSIITHVR